MPTQIPPELEQRVIKCRGCNRDMFHFRNGSPKWQCEYCDLPHDMMRPNKKDRRKWELYKLRYANLFSQIRWAANHDQLDEAVRELNRLDSDLPGPNIELAVLDRVAEQRRAELNGVWLEDQLQTQKAVA